MWPVKTCLEPLHFRLNMKRYTGIQNRLSWLMHAWVVMKRAHIAFEEPYKQHR